MALISTALSIDALSIGASCALRGIKIPILSKIIICAVGCAVTAAAVFAGGFLCGFLPENFGTAIGAVMLTALGIYIIAGALTEESKEKIKDDDNSPVGIAAEIIRFPDSCDRDKSKSVEISEAMYIGTALSADSFAAGLGAGLGGSGYMIPILCGLFQFLFLYFGELAGRKLNHMENIKQKHFSIISGLILIILAGVRVVSALI